MTKNELRRLANAVTLSNLHREDVVMLSTFLRSLADEPSVKSRREEETEALHLIQCGGCPAWMKLPYTGASRTSVSLHLARGWTFTTQTGWQCPKCSDPNDARLQVNRG